MNEPEPFDTLARFYKTLTPKKHPPQEKKYFQVHSIDRKKQGDSREHPIEKKSAPNDNLPPFRGKKSSGRSSVLGVNGLATRLQSRVFESMLGLLIVLRRGCYTRRHFSMKNAILKFNKMFLLVKLIKDITLALNFKNYIFLKESEQSLICVFSSTNTMSTKYF